MSDIVIYGAGKTGMALKSLLQHNDVAIYDDVPSKCSGVVDWEKVKLVITSPGIAPTSKFVAQCRQRGVKVVGELQFCYWLCNNPIVSVTGTNGKTTVTQLIKHMMEACNKKCSLLGNGGTPFSQNIAHLEDDSIVVLESSSFQLDDCVDFAPNVSAFTNLAPDHLDYHQSYANYVEAKCNNFVHQKDNQWAIFNMDDANVVELSTKCKAGKLYFSTIKPCNCYYKDGYVIVDFQGTTQKVKFESSYSQHNLSNVLCAALCVAALGLDVKQALQNIADFKFDKHRLQFVASVNGVRFVDDSKATNLHAVISALHSIEGKACLILGGVDKGLDFADLFANSQFLKVKFVACIGQTSRHIVKQAARFGIDCMACDTLGQATLECYKRANGGDTVLLSPGCSSFDMFDSYKARGEQFQQAVKDIAYA